MVFSKAMGLEFLNYCMYGESADANEEAADQALPQLRELRQFFAVTDVWNADETVLKLLHASRSHSFS